MQVRGLVPVGREEGITRAVKGSATDTVEGFVTGAVLVGFREGTGVVSGAVGGEGGAVIDAAALAAW